MEYCNYKLDEAKYFLVQMEKLQQVGNLTDFSYNLNAFLTSTRSISAYLGDNIKEIDVFQLVNKDYKMKFLKEQRNFTVHEKLLETSAMVNVDIESSITVNVKEEIKIETYEENTEGKKVEITTETEPEYNNIFIDDQFNNEDYVRTSHQFFFEEWDKGPEDIVSLCLYSIDWLEKMISKLINEGLLK
ncbi:hypothetical protein [Oceanobacillus polygoni]|uniref:Uncharacterized protein n=1 Tax=Oceanobacillus polygoni TaxID=1235259 RepID=A0A9X1CAH7_9BACI|nr:hypothetical protein [Oceanobacillus polygoni]MBP2075881.1 hypothetical protein [Oceanobacillus polygoni]